MLSQVAKKRFIDDLAVEAIEGCLVAKLKDIFTPLDVSRMPDRDVAKIAGETSESRQTRENLEAKLRILSYGLETCRRFAEFKMEGTCRYGHLASMWQMSDQFISRSK